MTDTRAYRFDLICPHCGKASETVADKRTPEPDVNCGDCLMNDVRIVKMKVLAVHDEKMSAARDVVRELTRQEERRLRGYDPGCADLAQYFLIDEPALKERVGELARHIQDAIEDWIEGARQEVEAEGKR